MEGHLWGVADQSQVLGAGLRLVLVLAPALSSLALLSSLPYLSASPSHPSSSCTEFISAPQVLTKGPAQYSCSANI